MWWVGGWWVVCKPILVLSLSLGQAEQLSFPDTHEDVHNHLTVLQPLLVKLQGVLSSFLKSPPAIILRERVQEFWKDFGQEIRTSACGLINY